VISVTSETLCSASCHAISLRAIDYQHQLIERRHNPAGATWPSGCCETRVKSEINNHSQAVRSRCRNRVHSVHAQTGKRRERRQNMGFDLQVSVGLYMCACVCVCLFVSFFVGLCLFVSQLTILRNRKIASWDYFNLKKSLRVRAPVHEWMSLKFVWLQ